MFSVRTSRNSEGGLLGYHVVDDYYRREHFDATPTDRCDGRPRVAFGRFFEYSGRLTAPVGLGVNHIFIDGAAIGRLVDEVQAEFDQPG